MADKPILFSGPMVRALIDGRKSMTRRVLKPQPQARGVRANGFFGMTNKFSFTLCHDGGANETQMVTIPYATGDRLWVREAHKALLMGDFPVMWYRSDDSDKPISADQYFALESKGWRPSIHMPRWASRLTLTVTDVRVQRVQEISEADALSEGIERLKSGRGFYDPTQSKGAVRLGAYFNRASDAFRILWDSLNEARGYGWKANPWIVAYTFDVHRQNIDEMEATQ